MKITVNGYMLAYTDRGQGLPVVFVHGYPLSQGMWTHQITALSDVNRVITLDLRGHGESQPIPGPYTMELFADDLAGLLDALEIPQAVLCGLSMGGYAVLAFYRKYPARAAGLILAATRAADDTPQARLARDQAIQTANTSGIRAVVEGMLPKLLAPENYQNHPDLVASLKAIMMTISLVGMVGDLSGMKNRPDSKPFLAGIKAPTLIVHGTEDQIIPLQEAQDMQAAIPNARLVVIPKAGHLLNLEQPELFNRAVREFLITF